MSRKNRIFILLSLVPLLGLSPIAHAQQSNARANKPLAPKLTQASEQVKIKKAIELNAASIIARTQELLNLKKNQLTAKQLQSLAQAIKDIAQDDGIAKDIRGEAWSVLGQIILSQAEIKPQKRQNKQLRMISKNLNALGNTRQNRMSEFWQTQAKIMDWRYQGNAWQKQVYQPMKELEKFYYRIQGAEDDASHTAKRMARDAGVTLLALYDRLGMSQALLGLSLVMQVDSQYDGQLKEALKKQYSAYQLLGKIIDFKIKTVNKGQWWPAKHRGKNVILYFYRFEDYKTLFVLQQEINRLLGHAQQAGQDVAFLFVQLQCKKKVNGPMLPGYPCYQETQKKQSISGLLGVSGTKRAVWIGKDGRIKALGGDLSLPFWFSQMGLSKGSSAFEK